MKAKPQINEIETHAKVSWIRKTRSVASKATHCEWRPGRFRVGPMFDPNSHLRRRLVTKMCLKMHASGMWKCKRSSAVAPSNQYAGKGCKRARQRCCVSAGGEIVVIGLSGFTGVPEMAGGGGAGAVGAALVGSGRPCG
jgi:hypothetical protein